MDPAESPSVNTPSTIDKPNGLRRLYNIDPHVSKRSNKTVTISFVNGMDIENYKLPLISRHSPYISSWCKRNYLSVYLRKVNFLFMKSSTLGKGKYYSLSMWEYYSKKINMNFTRYYFQTR